MDEVGIGLLCPTARHLIELAREDAHGYRDVHALRVEEAELVLPIETSRRDPRVRQPVVGDVVEDVVSGQAFLGPVRQRHERSAPNSSSRGRASRRPGRRGNPQSRTAPAGGSPSRVRSPRLSQRSLSASRRGVFPRHPDRTAPGRRTRPPLRRRPEQHQGSWCGCRSTPEGPVHPSDRRFARPNRHLGRRSGRIPDASSAPPRHAQSAQGPNR